MPPEEALIVAIKTNNLRWIQQILDRFPCDYSEAMELAAGTNSVDVVNLIITDIFTGSSKSSMQISNRFMYNSQLIMEKGGLSAARNGHVAVLERLLPVIVQKARKTSRCVPYWSRGVPKIFDEGAVHGHLGVVKFMTEHASTKRVYSELPLADTLSKVITAGHVHVAEFLLDLGGEIRYLEKVFVVALNEGQILLAERIRGIYGRDLLIKVARSGDLNAVEYLYNNGCTDSELVGRALIYAASEAHIEVVKFLLDSDCVSSEAFEKAFKRACSGYKPECIDTVVFLYKLNRASPQCIECGFGLANTSAVVKFLFENEKMSDQAITAAFESAVHDCRLDIILVVYKHRCIPLNLVEKAFLRAVKSQDGEYLDDEAKPTKAQVVKCLRDDERLTPNTLGEAFIDAVQHDKKEMMLSLYDEQRTPPEFLVKAFVEAAHGKNTGLVKEILKLLSVEANVPREFMHETFVAAARYGEISVMKHVCESLTADLPLEVLKNAIAVAGNDKTKNLIRKVSGL
ncbi:hypothetical protein DVH05_025089 [Phytophthora capsici]|nr:hypothetical protein DVH05_025089 [Phytophthora capsici]